MKWFVVYHTHALLGQTRNFPGLYCRRRHVYSKSFWLQFLDMVFVLVFDFGPTRALYFFIYKGYPWRVSCCSYEFRNWCMRACTVIHSRMHHWDVPVCARCTPAYERVLHSIDMVEQFRHKNLSGGLKSWHVFNMCSYATSRHRKICDMWVFCV